MKRTRITMSIVLATLILVSLFAVVSSPASVSGQASGTTAPLDTNPVGGTTRHRPRREHLDSQWPKRRLFRRR
jgi:hypothetical protein